MVFLMYCLSSVSGGAVAYLRHLVPLLAERFAEASEGHSLRFLAHEQQATVLQGIDRAQVHWLRGVWPAGYRRVVWERRNLGAIVAEQGVDVLFNPYQIGPHARGVKTVLMLRNMEPFLSGRYRYSLKSRLRNELLRRVSIRSLGRADRVIAVSEFARDYLTSTIGIEGHRIRTIYHGRNEAFASAENAENDRVSLKRNGVGGSYILTCGSLLPYRRSEDVVAAFNRRADHLPAGTQLVIAGAGTDRRYGALLHRAVESSPHRDRILPLGHVPWETMMALYRRCLLCVMATEIEACPNVAIEAMASGCVIVSSDRPPLPEMFEGCSLEYRARDVNHLAQQMQLAADDASLRCELKVRALQRAEAFSWEKCASETYSALIDW